MPVIDFVAVAFCSIGTLLDLKLPWMRSGPTWYTFWAIWFAWLAVMNAIGMGRMPVAIAWAALAGANAWLAYKQRPPRKRKPSKVAARIRDLGHRLAVVPASGGG